MAELEISVLKYESEYTKRSKDLKKAHWFSFPNDLLLHPDFLDIDGEELKCFVWILSICSKVNQPKIRLNVEHSVRIVGLKKESLFSMILKLQEKQILVSADLIAALSRPEGDPSPTNSRPDDGPYITGITGITKQVYSPLSEESGLAQNLDTPEKAPKVDFSFGIENVYLNFYPLKKGKTKGIAKLKKEIKTPDALAELEKAIKNYAASITDPKFIKHFDTFASEWRDWLDPLAGKVQIVKVVSTNNGVQRAKQTIQEMEQSNSKSTGNPDVVKLALANSKFGGVK